MVLETLERESRKFSHLLCKPLDQAGHGRGPAASDVPRCHFGKNTPVFSL